MKDKICMFCGHRTGTNDFFALEAAVTGAILEGCTIFYSGSMGEFDMQSEKAVRRAKSDGFDLKLCTVLPYMKKSMNDPDERERLAELYDDVIIPELPSTARLGTKSDGYAKMSLITERNRWMVDHSDMMICYVREGSTGGAEKTLRYAERRGIEIFRL